LRLALQKEPKAAPLLPIVLTIKVGSQAFEITYLLDATEFVYLLGEAFQVLSEIGQAPARRCEAKTAVSNANAATAATIQSMEGCELNIAMKATPSPPLP
jgi:hypothetical protein